MMLFLTEKEMSDLAREWGMQKPSQMTYGREINGIIVEEMIIPFTEFSIGSGYGKYTVQACTKCGKNGLIKGNRTIHRYDQYVDKDLDYCE